MKAVHLLQEFHRIGDVHDAIPRLRRFILDLAFRGKLVPQKLHEGTSETLMESIKEMHPPDRKFGGRGKNGEKQLDPLHCPGVLNIPPTWRWAFLDYLCEQIGDVDHKMPKATSDGVPFVSARDLKDDGSIDFERAKRVSEEDYRRLSRKIQIRRDDIVYSRIGTIGKARLVSSDVRFIISYSCCLIRPLKQFVDVRFLQQFLESQVALNQAIRGTQGIGVPDLGLGEIKRFNVPLPPLPEQKRIVAKVDELMTLCDKLEAAHKSREATRDRLTAASLARLNSPDPDPNVFANHARFALDNLPALTTNPNQIKYLRQAILNLAVHGLLVSQDPHDESGIDLLKKIRSEKVNLEKEGKLKKDKELWDGLPKDPPYRIPKNWIWTRLQETFEISRGGSPRPAGDPQYFGGSIPWITVREITKDNGKYLTQTDSGLTELGATKSRFISPNDLLLTNSGATLGVPKISKIRGCMNDGVAVLRQFHSVNLNDFAYLYLQSQTEAFRQVNQGMGQPNLNTQIIAGWFLPLPPLSEQHRIVAKVDDLMALCDRLEAQLNVSQSVGLRFLETILHETISKTLPQ